MLLAVADTSWNHAPIVFVELSNSVDHCLVPFMVSMRHVETRAVHATSSQSCQHLCGTRLGAYCTNNFGPSGAPEACWRNRRSCDRPIEATK